MAKSKKRQIYGWGLYAKYPPMMGRLIIGESYRCSDDGALVSSALGMTMERGPRVGRAQLLPRP
jgi:hypothetical protein